ncbi:MAG: hypothetical protein NTW14_07260 [bacterium]|nr:hypothetical protein [bacterium]
MSWTSLAIIRKHLSDASVAATTVEDEVHALYGITLAQLEHKSITLNSEEVKTIDLAGPYSAGSKVLSGTSWSSLVHENLVPNSIVVSGDQALDTVYVEGTDYVILYETGRIKRVTGSAIPDGGTVYVWYFYYTVQVKDTDYQIDYDKGKLNRISNGSIADGSTVYVDYTTSAGTVTDDLINEAITEAEDKILARLKDGYNGSSTDQGLKTGATELALAIVCNAKAMDMMLKSPSDEADGAASQWKVMSQRYERQAWETLDRFLKARSPHAPQAVQNESWSIWAD